MDENHVQKHELLIQSIQQLAGANKVLEGRLKDLAKDLQQTRNLLEGLAAIGGLEYSQDLQAWVSKKKLDELRRNPREEK